MPIRATPTGLLAGPTAKVDWSGVRVTWVGWDGSEWELSDPASGVQLGAGIRGLTMPKVDRYTSTSPAVAGSRYRGSRTVEREVFWPLAVFADAGSQAWIEYDRAFWSTLHPERVGFLRVEQPSGETRELACRFSDDGDQSFDVDPTADGWASYGVTLVAEDPYWTGQKIVRSWETAAPAPFLGGPDAAAATPFFISSGNTLDNATMPNPGDVEAYPIWTITGPTTAVAVGVGDNLVSYTGAIADGASITIDTRPSRLSVTDQNGVDKLAFLDQADFTPIQPGSQVPLTLNMTGTGSVSAVLRPLYMRAW